MHNITLFLTFPTKLENHCISREWGNNEGFELNFNFCKLMPRIAENNPNILRWLEKKHCKFTLRKFQTIIWNNSSENLNRF